MILGAEISRRTGEIFILDPKRVKENVRVRLLTDDEGAIRHLEVDPVKGYEFPFHICLLSSFVSFWASGSAHGGYSIFCCT